ncbi:MAG: hypothetical protein WAU63_05520 [Methylovirgula sp.]
MKKAVLAIPFLAFSLIALGTSARAQVLTYNCGNEFNIRADITDQFVVWITPDGTKEVHRAQVDDTYISWDLRSPTPMRMDRKSGLTERWAANDLAWKKTGDTCSLEK